MFPKQAKRIEPFSVHIWADFGGRRETFIWVASGVFYWRSLKGGILSTVLHKLWGKREFRILIIGLDGAGKTTILNRLQVQ